MKQWPGINDWLFALKTFAASMLALYIALAIGLDRPYWAMATVYIVAQPLTGSLRSKAAYRLFGTIVGASATIVFVPNLVDAPELLCTAMALWTGLCLYVALLDRTPRSYVFLLAGYTAALIGFQAVTTPEQMWDIALARVEEVWLGVICTTMVGAVVFPRSLAPLLSQRLLAWVGNASAWAEEVLGPAEASAGHEARIQLAADAVELRMLTSFLAYDTSKLQTATRWVGELERRMVLLLPLLSSIGDRTRALRAVGGMTASLERLLAELRVWVRAGAPPPRSEADRLRAAISELEAETDPRVGWADVMRASLLLRLRNLVDLRQDMRDLRRHIGQGGGPLPVKLAVQLQGPEALHRDHGLALLSALAAVLTILVICTFWIKTGWQAGAGAAELAAAACSLFASLDDPTQAQKRFLFAATVAVGAVGIGLFAVLPSATSFEMLVLALGAFFIPVCLMISNPALQPLGAALGFLTATLLSVQTVYTADFITYADGGLAIVLGLAGAAVMTSLVRSVGAEWSARRLLRAGWRDLAAIPTGREQQDANALTELLVDRLGLLVPRLAAVGVGNDLAAADVLADVRVGFNMVGLQRDRATLPPSARGAVDAVLFGAATQFAVQAALGHTRPPPATLLQAIDHAFDEAIALPDTAPGSMGRMLLLHLEGIRRALFADAEPYRGAPPPEAPAPETPAPDTPAPDTPAPDTPAPDTQLPDTPSGEPETREAA